MGQPTGDNQGDKQQQGDNRDNGHKDGGVALSQYVMTEAQRQTQADANAAAPSTFGGRAWEVTKEGVAKIPQGFNNSLDVNQILPNVAAGAVIGAATRLILPESGPVAKVAGTLMTGYFLGKPMYETYKDAYFAQTMDDIHHASDKFGNTVGGLPVGLAEGAVGGYFGSKAMGMALNTKFAAPFTNWKEGQYAKLDTKIDSGMVDLNNFAHDQFGIGNLRLKSGAAEGVIPPHLLEELAKRNPNGGYAETIRKMNAVKEEMSATGPIGNRAVNAEGTAPRSVSDAGGQEVEGTLVRSEGQPPIGDAEADAVYDMTGNVRTFYKEVHGRNSIDGHGMPLDNTVNYGEDFENAFWNGRRMTFGRPGANSPFRTFVKQDITGHEMTHGVTQYEANTAYRDQAGALNEHFSDVWGELVEQRASGTSAKDADWLVGGGIWKDGIKGDALRSMLKPGEAYNDPALGKDPQPAHMRSFVKTTRDNGGVHINSGIPNKAFATFAQDVGGNAWEAPAQVWYKARAAAGENPTFATFAYQTIEAAKALGQTDLVPKLQKAWDGVGVKPSATDTGRLPRGNMAWVPIVAGGSDGANRT